MITSFFSAYLSLNVVIAAAVMALFLIAPWIGKLNASAQLKLHYAILGFVMVSPLLLSIYRPPSLFRPVMKVWNSSPSAVASVTANSRGVLVLSDHVSVSADYLFLFVIGLCLGSLLFGLCYVAYGQWQVRQILRASFLYKRIRFANVLISEECLIPFSYRGLCKAYVVLPSYLLNQPENFKMSVAHELQHHRQGDTAWAYARLLLGAVCFLNPLIYFWNRWIDEVQEFACDEKLVGRQDLVARAYARCLIQVAETAWVQAKVPVGATGMILLSRGQLLNRRIKSMFEAKKIQGRFVWLAPFMLVAAVVTSAAFAAKGMVQDRRITMAQAQSFVQTSARDSEIPLRVNEEVLVWLNYYVGTPAGRLQMKEALRRMEAYRSMIGDKILAYHVPSELIAIPLIESGYQNLPESNKAGVGAGLWMFIASTARHFGLKVDKAQDQRLHEEKETEAAMRYLLGNKLRFDDWELSIIAYNAGEAFVQKEIDRLGTRDAWELLSKGGFRRETREYLPKLNAAILIMKSPSLIE